MDQTNSIAIPSDNTATKDDFRRLVRQIDAASDHHASTYPRIIALAAQFDKELAARLQACAAADQELFRYLKSKAEAQQPQGIIARIGALILGR